MRHKQAEVQPANKIKTVGDDPKLKELADKADKVLRKDTFLPASDLQVSDDYRDALIKTLELLERGGVYHYGFDKYIKNKYPFNMDQWGGHCGSVCCIGGTAQWILGHDVGVGRRIEGRPTQLNRLFFPHHIKDSWNNLTPKVAAIALRTYLETGNEDWVGALKKSKEG